MTPYLLLPFGAPLLSLWSAAACRCIPFDSRGGNVQRQAAALQDRARHCSRRTTAAAALLPALDGRGWGRVILTSALVRRTAEATLAVVTITPTQPPPSRGRGKAPVRSQPDNMRILDSRLAEFRLSADLYSRVLWDEAEG